MTSEILRLYCLSFSAVDIREATVFAPISVQPARDVGWIAELVMADAEGKKLSLR
jgi:hypothetical protein